MSFFSEEGGVAATSEVRSRVQGLWLEGIVLRSASDFLEALEKIDTINLIGTVIALIEEVEREEVVLAGFAQSTCLRELRRRLRENCRFRSRKGRDTESSVNIH
jgi:hypothetical protein